MPLELINNKPFNSQQDMLRSLNLKNVRTINKYKDTGGWLRSLCAPARKFKWYFFFSYKLSEIELTDLKNNNFKINSKGREAIADIVNKKSILIWAYKNDVLINNSPFLSIIKAGNELNLNRKLIRKYLDSERPYRGIYFYSKAKPNLK